MSRRRFKEIREATPHKSKCPKKLPGWTEEEDKTLMVGVEKHGLNFDLVSRGGGVGEGVDVKLCFCLNFINTLSHVVDLGRIQRYS